MALLRHCCLVSHRITNPVTTYLQMTSLAMCTLCKPSCMYFSLHVSISPGSHSWNLILRM